jgi:hypothetical protein
MFEAYHDRYNQQVQGGALALPFIKVCNDLLNQNSYERLAAIYDDFSMHYERPPRITREKFFEVLLSGVYNTDNFKADYDQLVTAYLYRYNL